MNLQRALEQMVAVGYMKPMVKHALEAAIHAYYFCDEGVTMEDIKKALRTIYGKDVYEEVETTFHGCFDKKNLLKNHDNN